MIASAEEERARTAGEAFLLLSQIIEDLTIPEMARLSQQQQIGGDPGPWLRMAVRSVIITLYRLKEIRDHFLVPWLFTDSDLRAMGLPPLSSDGPRRGRRFQTDALPGFPIWTDCGPHAGVHGAARPVGQLVNTSQHVNGSHFGDPSGLCPRRSRGWYAVTSKRPAQPRSGGARGTPTSTGDWGVTR